MNVKSISWLRILLIVLFVGTLLAQWAVWITANEMGMMYEEVTRFTVGYAVAGILAIACGQVVLVVIWRLLTRIAKDSIFSATSLRLVDAITWSFVVVTALSIGVTLHFLLIMKVGGPGMLLLLFAADAVGIALVLLMAVMRGLLYTATENRSELDEVI